MADFLQIWSSLLFVFAGTAFFVAWAAKRAGLGAACAWGVAAAAPALVFGYLFTADGQIIGGLVALVLTPVVFAATTLALTRLVPLLHAPRA